MTGCAIRPAQRSDIKTIVRFIRALAEFENLADTVTADEDTLLRNLFGPRCYAECLLAEIDAEVAGFAVYFHSFSTFLGKPGLYVEDIYVVPAFRRRGTGLAFFRELAKIAVARDCGRMEWSVLNWNERAIAFYRKLGAEPMSEWTTQRLTRTGIEVLANG
ncbi:MAG: N-acetyltransferase family protein [Rhizomicrobium sp.]